VKKKPTRTKDEAPVKDVPADDPNHTLERLASGLRRVLRAPKEATSSSRLVGRLNKR
jgi:hypothetical protein